MSTTTLPTRPMHRPARRWSPTGWLLAALVCLVPALQAGADTDADAAQRVVQEATQRFFEALEREGERARDPQRAYDLVEEFISPHVDTELAARLILGRHWRTATEEQRERFVDGFKWMLLRTYSTAVDDFKGVEIRYLPPRGDIREGEAEVRTRISHRGGSPVGVNYRMRQRDGEWLVVDLSIEGVSLVATYRGAFATEISRHGLDGLIERMGERRVDPAALNTPS
jgi:phospholipid transport system substrate-binding protein